MREFLFLICVKKAISMKILVLRVLNSSRHRNCFVRDYIHWLFVSKALTRSYLACSGFHTNNSWIQPRTPHFLWRKLYIRQTDGLQQTPNDTKLIPLELTQTCRAVPYTKFQKRTLLTGVRYLKCYIWNESCITPLCNRPSETWLRGFFIFIQWKLSLLGTWWNF